MPRLYDRVMGTAPNVQTAVSTNRTGKKLETEKISNKIIDPANDEYNL